MDLDRLKNYEPNFIGTLTPKSVNGLDEKAQWLDGIAAGAWFELHPTEHTLEFGYRRISPHGNVDVHGIYSIDDAGFNYAESYEFVHYSNCAFFHIRQNSKTFRFEKINN